MSGASTWNATEEPVQFEIPYSEVEPWLRGLHSLLAVSLMLASLAGNALVLWLVIKNKELQYRSIVASMGAITVNILFSLVTGPQVVAGSITGEWPLGEESCVAVGFIANSIFYVRWINTLLIAVDRFLYIVTPFSYQRNSKRILVILTIIVWTTPLLTSVPAAVEGAYNYRSSFTFCSIDCSEDNFCYRVYILVFAVHMIIGVLIPAIIYTFLYCYGKKKRRDMHRELGTITQPLPDTRTPNGNLLDYQMSMELCSIEEEREIQPVEEAHPPTATQELRTVSQHMILDTAELPPTHTHTSPQQETTSETRTHFETTGATEGSNEPPRTNNEEADKRKDDKEVEKSNVNGSIHLNSCRESSDSGAESIPSHSHQRVPGVGQRRTSIVVFSRAAISAIIPGRSQMAVQRRERQAMITFCIIFANLVLTQILLFILSAARRQSYYSHIPFWVHMIAINLFLLAPVIEPVIIMKNRDFKRVLSRMFHRRNSFSMSMSAPTR